MPPVVAVGRLKGRVRLNSSLHDSISIATIALTTKFLINNPGASEDAPNVVASSPSVLLVLTTKPLKHSGK